MTSKHDNFKDSNLEQNADVKMDELGLSGKILLRQLTVTKHHPQCQGTPLQFAWSLLMAIVSLQWKAKPAPGSDKLWILRDLAESDFGFVISKQIRVTREFTRYLATVKREGNVFWLPAPLNCSTKLAHFGKTSQVWTGTASSEGHHLFSFTAIGVIVDRETRVPKQPELKIPADKIPRLKNPPRITIKQSQSAAVLGTDVYTVNNDDIDVNNHATYSTYLTAFFECLEKCVHEGKLSVHGFKTPDDLYFEETTLALRGEAMLGDQLETRIWQDPQQLLLIQGTVSRGDTLLTQVQVVLLPQESSTLTSVTSSNL